GVAVGDVYVPSVGEAEVAEIKTLIEHALPPEGRTVALEDVLASVDAQPVKPMNAGLKVDPPVVFVSTRPAIVVNLEGAPIWRSFPGTPLLQYAVNTNWDLLRDASTGASYPGVGRTWLTASNVLGPWTPAAALPQDFKRLPSGDRWDEAKAAAPSRAAGQKTPRVFVSRQAAELIVLDGNAVYRRVPA